MRCGEHALGESLLRREVCLLQVGAIIGKGGEVISQLKSVIGVKIRISDRDDFVPGTRNRKVTISGAADAVQIAQVLPAHLSQWLNTCVWQPTQLRVLSVS